jgi:hypothetical protein
MVLALVTNSRWALRTADRIAAAYEPAKPKTPAMSQQPQ